jgi:cell division septation protein DedD
LTHPAPVLPKDGVVKAGMLPKTLPLAVGVSGPGATPPGVLPQMRPPLVVPAPVEPEGTASAEETAGNGFVVQVGSFVLRNGADGLVDRLRSRGLSAQVVQRKERVLLNSVQLGPFRQMTQAQELQVKLRASGFKGVIEHTDEGFIIPVSQSVLLSSAIQEMDRLDGLLIRPVRLVKSESTRDVHRVVLGPYASRQDAEEVGRQVGSMGVAVPLVVRLSERTAVPAGNGG